MNLVALDLPDNITDWPLWLEQHLVGLQLRDLVRQLELIQGKPSEALELENLIADAKTQLLQIGLVALNESQLVDLIQHPRLLFALQELVLTEGSSYWQRVARSDEHLAKVSSQSTAVTESVTGKLFTGELLTGANLPVAKTESAGIQVATRDVLSPPESSKTSSPNHSRRSWLTIAGTIAALLLIAIFPSLLPKQNEGNFFAKRGLLTSELQGSDFLLAISRSIQSDWNTKTSSDTELASQLQKFRDSCDTLINAELTQLPPAVAAELKKRCGVWKEKITNHLTQLNAGAPASDVQKESNTTIEKLTQFLSDLSKLS